MSKTDDAVVRFVGGCLNGEAMYISPGRHWINWPEIDAAGNLWANHYDINNFDGVRLAMCISRKLIREPDAS